ncbi:hypothetical protein AUR40_01255 [Ehrlichia ruminantium]|nr:hypothetical protein AUR40_01255 [Ehrlichia ruminantium]
MGLIYLDMQSQNEIVIYYELLKILISVNVNIGSIVIYLKHDIKYASLQYKSDVLVLIYNIGYKIL